MKRLESLQISNVQAQNEMHYLRGLSLQLQGNFAQSEEEYRYVLQHSWDEDLLIRARLGMTCAKLRLKALPPKLIRFPSSQAGNDGL